MKSNALRFGLLIIILFVVACLSGYLILTTIVSGGMKHIDAISATDLLFGKKISFPISFDKGYQSGGVLTSFKTKMTMSEMVKLVENKNPYGELKISYYDSKNAIITMELYHNQKAVYLIRKESDDDEYILFNMAAEFTEKPFSIGDEKTNSKTLKIVFPYHFVDDNNFKIDKIIMQNTNYLTTHNIDEFYNFYLNLDSYVVEKSNDEIVIIGYSNPLMSECAPELRKKIHISFHTIDNSHYFNVSYK